MIQLSCLRHFLAKLKKLDYFFEIKQLLKCTSQFDFENCIQNLINHFKNICNENPDEFTKINKILGKIGLQYAGDQITIENEEKWKRVSLLHRVDANMPSTTNTLEAMHGHINENCPRRNSFFSAIQRLICELDSKYQKINLRVKHNYNYTKNATIKKMQNTNQAEMLKMITFYETTEGHCKCGENKLQSSNFKIDIPCMHRLAIGEQFQQLQSLFLNLQSQYNRIVVDHCFLQDLYLPQIVNNEKQYIIQTIKHFSRYKKDTEIQNFVESYNYNDTDGFFINNQPVASLQVIEEGIYFFKKIKELEK